MSERKSFLLRIDSALYADVKRWADADLRSVNAQIEFLLRRAVDRRRGSAGPARDDAPPDSDSE